MITFFQAPPHSTSLGAPSVFDRSGRHRGPAQDGKTYTQIIIFRSKAVRRKTQSIDRPQPVGSFLVSESHAAGPIYQRIVTYVDTNVAPSKSAESKVRPSWCPSSTVRETTGGRFLRPTLRRRTSHEARTSRRDEDPTMKTSPLATLTLSRPGVAMTSVRPVRPPRHV